MRRTLLLAAACLLLLQATAHASTQTLQSTGDTRARQQWEQNVPRGAETTMRSRGGSGIDESRAFVAFDLSQLNIPASSTNVSAKLLLRVDQYDYVGQGANTSFVRRTTDPWDEATLTWNNQPSVAATEAPIDVGKPPGSDATADVTALLPAPRTGILGLRVAEHLNANDEQAWWQTREGAVGPRLEVSWTPPATTTYTANEKGFASQLQKGGTWANQGLTPIYKQCVPWLRPPGYTAPCDNGANRINVELLNWDWTPKNAAVQKSMENIPVPPGFTPATTADRQAIIDNMIENRYCELWYARHKYDDPTQPWTANWGGCADKSDLIDAGDGLKVWPTDAWRCGYPDPWWTCFIGTSGSGVVQEGGVVTLEDMQRGSINHPLHIAIKDGCGHKWPATRDDGRCWTTLWDGTSIIPMQYGAKIRLDSAVNVDAIRTGRRWCAPSKNRTTAEAVALGWDATTTNCPLPPMAKMILKAAQRYYLIATDQAGGGPNDPSVTFDIESPWRPRTGQWTDVPPGDPSSKLMGCDGLSNTGGGNAPWTSSGDPVGAGGEADCWPGQGQAWAWWPMSINQWHEIS